MADEVDKFLPADWEDNDRMNFMFSAFPESREVNPKHWDSKLNFWSNIILDSCRHISNDNVCIDLATLQRRFSRNGLTPLGLSTVICEMLKQGTLQRKEDFLKYDSDSWMSWSLGLAKKSFWWSVQAFAGHNGYSGDSTGQFVLVDFAKEKAEWILALHYRAAENETVDSVAPWNVLKTQCSCQGQDYDDDTLELLICALQKQGKASLFTTPEGEKVVKFAKKGAQRVDPLSENDLEIMRVKKTMASLTLRARKLTNEIESLRCKAAIYNKQGSQSMALKLLKKKKQQEKVLNETTGSLNSFEEILQRIQSGKTNQMVVEALKSATEALKKAQQGITAENVDDVMDDLNETLNTSEDIQAAISDGNTRVAETSGVGDDELEDLERELESLTITNKDSPAVIQPSNPLGDTLPTKLTIGLSPSAGRHGYSTSTRPSGHSPLQQGIGTKSSDLLEFPDTPTESPSKARDSRSKDLSRHSNAVQLTG